MKWFLEGQVLTATRVLGVFAVVLALGGGLSACDTPTEVTFRAPVSGFVFSAEGSRPIAGVQVRLVEVVENIPLARAATEADGSFVLDGPQYHGLGSFEPCALEVRVHPGNGYKEGASKQLRCGVSGFADTIFLAKDDGP